MSNMYPHLNEALQVRHTNTKTQRNFHTRCRNRVSFVVGTTYHCETCDMDVPHSEVVSTSSSRFFFEGSHSLRTRF